MSRDFVIEFASRSDLETTWNILKAAEIDGQSAFRLEDKGTSIFVELVYAHDIGETARLTSGDTIIPCIRQHVAFVALKNGVHNGTGYFSDSARSRQDSADPMPLCQIYHEILGMFRYAASAASGIETVDSKPCF